MSHRSNRVLQRGAAVLGSAVALAVATGPGAYAAGSGDGVKVVNTETVQVYLDSDAKPTTQRVYEQLALTGHGKADLTNPIATKGLRNLDGFSGVSVKGHDQVVDTTVDGEKTYRSVSDYTGRLPLEVKVAYTLDGKPVEAGDVVGRSGRLKVTYTVTNRTGQDEQVAWTDAQGNTRTSTKRVVIPMVGTLTTVAPSAFENVSSGEANMAGDGKGGTKLSFTMTLFPPIGAPSATFGYTADITHGVVPRAEISALPVDPLESPTFAKGAAAYRSGADSGTQLTEGATQIDDNLLKLRNGANELLGGIVQLRDGSAELSEGLSGAAAPGAEKLDAGANVLTAGLFKLVRGTGDLTDGTGRLADGTSQALQGGKKLSIGLKKLSGGLDTLRTQLTSKESADGIRQIREGILALQGGVGDPAAGPNDVTLIGGLEALNDQTTGLPSAVSGAGAIKDGLGALRGQTATGTRKGSGLAFAQQSLDGAKAQLDGSLTGADQLPKLLATAQALAANKAPGGDCGPYCQQVAGGIAGGISDSKTKLGTLSDGLGQISDGLGTALSSIGDADTPGQTLAFGAGRLANGLLSASQGSAKLQAAVENLIAPGLAKLLGGYDQLIGKLGDATTGVSLLDAGASQASTGGTALTSGLGDLDSGAGQLDAGATKLAKGAGQAATGSQKLADGTSALSAGITAAAAGSDKLTAGLRKAADSAPQLPEGATRLSNEGTKKLIAKGEETTQTYAENVAVLAASAKRAHGEQMAYGAPKDADAALTAYNYVIEGDDGEGGRNLVRTLGGAGLLAAGGGVLLLRRRFLV